MTPEKEVEKLYDEMHTVQLDRRFTVKQPAWEALHARYLELDAKIKQLKAGGKHATTGTEVTPKKPKAELTTEFSL